MEKIKIHFDEPEFFVNEEKKTVTCKLRGGLVLPFELFNIRCFWMNRSFDEEKIVTATAKCSPEDTFDIDKGKRIALAKAENKITYYFSDNVVDRIYSTIVSELTTSCEDFRLRSYKFAEHNYAYIEDLSNDVFKVKKPLNKGITKYASKNKKN